MRQESLFQFLALLYLKNLVVFLNFIIFTTFGRVFDEDDHKLVLVNNSSHKIYFKLLPDTVLMYESVYYLPEVSYLKLAPRDSGFPLFARKGEDWAEKINKISRDGKLRLFVFDADIVQRNSWDKIIRLKKYTRFDLSVKRLDSLNWHVTSPCRR